MNELAEFLLARIGEDETRATKHLPALRSHGLGDYGLRVLAECAAKRAIVALHEYEWMGADDAAGKACTHDYEDWPCPTMRHVAAVYKDHPDYRQEWD